MDFCGFLFLKKIFFCLLRATPVAHGSSQARGSNQSCSCRPTPQPQQRQIRAASATYTTAHSNAGSLTRWDETCNFMVPSQIRFHCATTGTLDFYCILKLWTHSSLAVSFLLIGKLHSFHSVSVFHS